MEEKNLDLEEFAFVVSHDLKTPLRNIFAISAFIKEDLKDNLNPTIKENFQLLEKQVVHMELLIKGVLDYSLHNDKSSVDKNVDLNVLVSDLAQLNSTEKCKISVLNKLPTVCINESQILQVFLNLIQNAIKYNDKPEGVIEIGVEEQEHFWQFYVKDNGKGIESVYFKKIFKTFQKLDISPNSSGIGLSIVKKIVSLYGGTVWLESQINKGTTFYFTLKK